MITTINNWKPEVRSLLKSLTDAGCKLERSHNGEDALLFNNNLAAFVEHLIACDEAHLRVVMPDGERRTLYLVLGNSPGELVCDYGCHDLLDKVTDAHYTKWEGRAQPKKTGAYLNGKFVSVDTYRRAQRNQMNEVNAVIARDNLYAQVGFDGSNRRVIDCHLGEHGDMVVTDLHDAKLKYRVNGTVFFNGRGQEVKFQPVR